MLYQLMDKIAGLPWYFWTLAVVWGGIELAGWLRMRRNCSRYQAPSWAMSGTLGADRWRQWHRAHE